MRLGDGPGLEENWNGPKREKTPPCPASNYRQRPPSLGLHRLHALQQPPCNLLEVLPGQAQPPALPEAQDSSAAGIYLPVLLSKRLGPREWLGLQNLHERPVGGTSKAQLNPCNDVAGCWTVRGFRKADPSTLNIKPIPAPALQKRTSLKR